MEKKDIVRKFVNKYINNSSECVHESITKYIGVDKEKIHQERKEIIDFFKANFFISGLTISYDLLRYDADNNEWIRLNNKNDLELFEQLIAIGYEAGIFHESYVLRFFEMNKLTRQELKYSIPEEFEYIDEEYYDGLNEGIIKKNNLYLDPSYYENDERTHNTRELLKYWFTTNNVPNAFELCEGFQYLLENKLDLLLNVATYLHISGRGPILLLFELNKNTNIGLIPNIEYTIKSLNKEDKNKFDREKEIFLNVLESEYKTNIIQKKKGLK